MSMLMMEILINERQCVSFSFRLLIGLLIAQRVRTVLRGKKTNYLWKNWIKFCDNKPVRTGKYRLLRPVRLATMVTSFHRKEEMQMRSNCCTWVRSAHDLCIAIPFDSYRWKLNNIRTRVADPQCISLNRSLPQAWKKKLKELHLWVPPPLDPPVGPQSTGSWSLKCVTSVHVLSRQVLIRETGASSVAGAKYRINLPV